MGSYEWQIDRGNSLSLLEQKNRRTTQITWIYKIVTSIYKNNKQEMMVLSFVYSHLIFQKYLVIPEVSPKTGWILHQICKVLKWGLFRLPAYVVNVMKVFAKFSGCNTHLLVGF